MELDRTQVLINLLLYSNSVAHLAQLAQIIDYVL